MMGRFETPRAGERPEPPTWMPLLAAATTIAELAVMTLVGRVRVNGVTWPVVGLWAFDASDVGARGTQLIQLEIAAAFESK